MAPIFCSCAELVTTASSQSQDKHLGSPSRVLVVKNPWACAIIRGDKIWEIRSTNTNVRERVGIAESGTQRIIGEVSLLDSFPLTAALFRDNLDKHGVANLADVIPEGRTAYAWVLSAPKEYSRPKKYSHPLGAINWVQIDPPSLTSQNPQLENSDSAVFQSIDLQFQHRHIN